MCHEAGQSAFLQTQLYLSTNLDHILFSNFLGTNSLSVLMCRKAVNQSINMQKDIQILEKIQISATKIVHRLKHLCYKDRLDKLGLTTLFFRRKRGDLIETYKILTDTRYWLKKRILRKNNSSSCQTMGTSSWTYYETSCHQISPGHQKILL